MKKEFFKEAIRSQFEMSESDIHYLACEANYRNRNGKDNFASHLKISVPMFDMDVVINRKQFDGDGYDGYGVEYKPFEVAFTPDSKGDFLNLANRKELISVMYLEEIVDFFDNYIVFKVQKFHLDMCDGKVFKRIIPTFNGISDVRFDILKHCFIDDRLASVTSRKRDALREVDEEDKRQYIYLDYVFSEKEKSRLINHLKSLNASDEIVGKYICAFETSTNLETSSLNQVAQRLLTMYHHFN